MSLFVHGSSMLMSNKYVQLCQQAHTDRVSFSVSDGAVAVVQRSNAACLRICAQL